jgi:hypothetical protein
MKRIYISVFCIVIVLSVQAQQGKQKGTLSVSAETALLNGDNHVNGQVLLTAGCEFKGWFVGAGSGFDYYKYRTVPVFIDVKKYWGKGNRKLFVYANGGADVAWPTESQKNLRTGGGWWGWSPPSGSIFKNGIYTDIGFGYTLFNSKHRGFFTALGYSTKTMTEKYDEQVWNGTATVTVKRTLDYTMNKVLLRIGYKF